MGDKATSRDLSRLIVWGLGACLSFSLGCESTSEGAPLEADATVVRAGTSGFRPDAPPDLCGLEIQRLLEQEPLPGTPEFDGHRAEILARARSVPLVFHRRPEAPPEASDKVQRLRALLRSEEDPANAILEVLRRTRGNYEERRAVFLSEQYLYADEVVLALRMSQVLRLDHLFGEHERELVIQRGNEIIEVSRREGKYWLPPLPDARNPNRHHHRLASLLLYDRVRLKSEFFGERLHVDLRPLQSTLGFSQVDINHRTSEGFVGKLMTYGVPSRAILRDQDGTLVLECESVEPERRESLRRARAEYHLDQELIEPVLAASHEMIDRSLPFDEPKTEEGQQDGLLRIHFRKAYKHYQSTYEFNGDNYYVFDGYGHPRVPQVCIDFITDSFDWGTGGRWPVRGEKRLYQKGALNFASMGIENPRSVENLAEFASETPEWFDMLWFEKKDRIKFRHRTQFFDALAKNNDKFRRGDVVFIYGLKDDGKFHYHSFLIDEKDPVTGMPMVVVANAGPPQARSWEGEMQNAPLRSIVARMRVKREILARAHEQRLKVPGVPLAPPPRAGKEVEVPEEEGVEPPEEPTTPQPAIAERPRASDASVDAAPNTTARIDFPPQVDSESSRSPGSRSPVVLTPLVGTPAEQKPLSPLPEPPP